MGEYQHQGKSAFLNTTITTDSHFNLFLLFISFSSQEIGLEPVDFGGHRLYQLRIKIVNSLPDKSFWL